ncbi:hypothetical protein [Pseudescherichia sp.]|uniref:hypothetical protein n=1 Tax=Pseudescherichia sp. TaxID=2055881 RepID=UPI00289EB0BE|nr:hypothetical protein [Pseudescherichia sp.]
MGKKVKVKYVKQADEFPQANTCRDMTVGKVYDAYVPDDGEIDPYGYEVQLRGELWIDNDDVGEKAVCQFFDNFEIVEG